MRGIGHALRNRKGERWGGRERRKCLPPFVHLLFFFSSSSIGNRFELKRAAADLTSGPLRPVNRIKWNGGLTKWQWSTRTRRFLFPVQRCGHCSSSRCLSGPANRHWYFQRRKKIKKERDNDAMIAISFHARVLLFSPSLFEKSSPINHFTRDEVTISEVDIIFGGEKNGRYNGKISIGSKYRFSILIAPFKLSYDRTTQELSIKIRNKRIIANIRAIGCQFVWN